MATKKLSSIVIDALEDIKARDIKLINVARLTSVFDYIAIASAESTRQTKALAKNVMDKVKAAGGWIYGIEGEQSGEWVLVDCGDVVVHIMQPAVREHYKLEELWGEGKLEFPLPVVKKAVVKKPVAAKLVVAKPVVKKPVVKKRNAAPKVVAKVKPAVAKAKPATAKITKRKTTAALPVVKSKTVKVTKVVAKRKVGVKKAVTKTTPAARAKTPVTTLKKTAVKKPAAKKPTVKKPTAKTAVAKKLVVKKPTMKKTVTKKTTSTPVTGRRKAGA